MKKLFILVFIVITTIVNGQSLCNYTLVPAQIYYPNTIYTPTNSSIDDVEYLCGPNTIVYDTIHHGCDIYVSANCTLTLKYANFCSALTNIYLKNNSVLNLKIGQTTGIINILKEPLAIVNNPNSATIYSITTCTAISFPVVNCTASGIKTFEKVDAKISLYPKPANDILNIKSETFNNDIYKIEIYNNIGQLIKEDAVATKNQTITLNTNDLPNGVYYLKLKNDNSFALSKRFIISR